MKFRKHDLPSRVDRPVDRSDEVEVADARRVVPRRQRPSDEQIGNPAKRHEPAPQLLHDRGRDGHERILGACFVPDWRSLACKRRAAGRSFVAIIDTLATPDPSKVDHLVTLLR
jgi:hypothetical protein